jgi:hypothetical protein
MLFRISSSEFLVGVSDHVLVKLRNNNLRLNGPNGVLVYE